MRVIRPVDPNPYGIKLGSILVSLLDPDPGRAVEFHRWYERDHFYAGCMVGPGFFAGRRFVATRPLKAIRPKSSPEVIPEGAEGTYLALYWIVEGEYEQTLRWAVDKVNWLGANGRMAAVRKQAHAGFYVTRFTALRDEDGVPPELALDHPFPGVVLTLSLRREGVEPEALDRFLLEEQLPRALSGSAAAMCISLDPMPLPEDSPSYVVRPPNLERRRLDVWFLDEDPRESWDELFTDFGKRIARAGIADVLFASGFIPTIPGTDRYADEI